MNPTPSHIDLKFPPVFLEFTHHCEVYCVAGCCGLDAFSFDEETLEAAIGRLGIEKADEACRAGIEFANAHRAENAECWSGEMELNHCWKNGEEFHQWTTGLVTAIREQIRMRAARGGINPPLD